MANITDTLKEQMKDLLTEESLEAIEQAFNAAVEERTTLTTEAALAKQDDDHATKVQTLLEAIDDDHVKKLERIVEAVTTNHTNKLKQVVKRYETALQSEASEYKGTLVGGISNYLDLYLNKTYPQDMLEEAVKNKRFEHLVTEMRKVLGVDMALATTSIKDAILDGKTTIDNTQSKLNNIVKENNKLKQELSTTQSELALETLTKGLPQIKKKYIHKVLGNKDAKFINENFQYTLDLFDKESDDKATVLKEEAARDVKGSVDPVVVREVVTEKATNDNDEPMWGGYMNELGKY